jgi:hypothetical protein
MVTPSHRGGLTTTETRLVEQYVSVLDYVSRCAQAIDHGDWFYLYDKAGTLAEEAARLAELAREAYDAPRRPPQAGGAGGGGLVRPPLPGRPTPAPPRPPRR